MRVVTDTRICVNQGVLVVGVQDTSSKGHLIIFLHEDLQSRMLDAAQNTPCE